MTAHHLTAIVIQFPWSLEGRQQSGRQALGNTWRRLEEAASTSLLKCCCLLEEVAAARLELWPCLTCQGHVPAYLVPVLPGPTANSPQPDANPSLHRHQLHLPRVKV